MKAVIHPIEVPPPTPGGGQWWPTLHLRRGRLLQPVTIAQCNVVSAEYRARALRDGRGCRDTPEIKLYDACGEQVAVIHWNGSIQSVEGHPIP